MERRSTQFKNGHDRQALLNNKEINLQIHNVCFAYISHEVVNEDMLIGCSVYFVGSCSLYDLIIFKVKVSGIITVFDIYRYQI